MKKYHHLNIEPYHEHFKIPTWVAIILAPVILVSEGVEKAKSVARKIKGKK